MPFMLTDADRGHLVGVDARLVQLAERLAEVSPIQFKITEGVRSLERQKALYADKKTKTLKSKHLIGHAIDVVPIVGGKVSWEWKHFTPLIRTAKKVSVQLGTPMKFGYDWGWDAPHMELV